MSVTEIDLEYDWFIGLENNEKGDLGEKLVEIYLKPRLRDAFGVSRVRVSYDITFHSNPVDQDGNHDHHMWRADLTFQNYDIDEKIIVEVKTGQYAELERRQRSVMEWLARNPENRILRADVDLRPDSFLLEFAEFMPKSDALWGPVDFLEEH